MNNAQIWQWTLTKESIAPCFVRDVLAMRPSTERDADFFWLGHTPCRTVLLVGMVVAIQVYDKRAIYTIDDGTAVIDCVLRHPNPALSAPAPRIPPRPMGGPSAKTDSRCPSPKKPRLDKAKSESTELPPPITEPGYPVRVVGKVARHFQSKQIHADTIDPCPSSLDEIAHLERVIDLHKTKYSLAVPFALPPKSTSRAAPPCISTRHADADVDASIFSNPLPISHPGPNTTSYALPAPPRMPMPLQNRNQFPSIPMHVHATYHGHMHVPSSPTASSIASSAPSSPSKPSSPIKAHELSRKPKLRHPSRLHKHDLTANTFRLYVKHYMDNAPPLFPTSCPSPSRSTCGGVTTPMKHARDEEGDEPTPRPRPSAKTRDGEEDGDEDRPTLGFTLSHLRRVPELALLAARTTRAEIRNREKAAREKEQANSRTTPSAPSSLGRSNRRGNVNRSTATPQTGAAADPPRKKIARLFSWAVVKLYEEGSIVLWDGGVRPLPVPPPPLLSSGLWNNDTRNSTLGAPSASRYTPSISGDLNMSTSRLASVLYNSSASASLYSHYHAPRRPSASKRHHHHDEGWERDVDVVDADADPAYLSDPAVDEEAYVPLTPRFFAGYVREAVDALRHGGLCSKGAGRGGVGVGVKGGLRGVGGTGREPTPQDILTYLQRTDGRWARVGVWVVEEALTILKGG